MVYQIAAVRADIAAPVFNAQGFLCGPPMQGVSIFYGTNKTRRPLNNVLLPDGVGYRLLINHGNGDKTHCVDTYSGEVLSCIDGVWTRQKRLLNIYSADCIPTVIVTPKGRGMAHVGRGNLQVVIKLLEELDAPKEQTFIQFGPHICPHCYVLEEDDMHGLNSDCMQCTGLGYYKYDISQALYLLLLEWGILDDNICRFGDGFCTACSRDAHGLSVFDSLRRWRKENRGDSMARRPNYPMISYVV